MPLAVGPAISQMRGSTRERPCGSSSPSSRPTSTACRKRLPQALEAVAGAGSPIEDTDILGDGAADIFFEHDDPTIVRARAEDALERERGRHLRPAGRAPPQAAADRRHGFHHHRLSNAWTSWPTSPASGARWRRSPSGPCAASSSSRTRCASGWPCSPGLPLARPAALLRRAGASSIRARGRWWRRWPRNGARCVLVSGGFEFFTSRVAHAAGFHADWANRLIDDGEALDRPRRRADPRPRRQARHRCAPRRPAFGVAMVDTLAVGDGANDLDMIKAAGLGVAYRAKPVLAGQADARVDQTDLTALLYFQGYGRRPLRYRLRRKCISRPPCRRHGFTPAAIVVLDRTASTSHRFGWPPATAMASGWGSRSLRRRRRADRRASPAFTSSGVAEIAQLLGRAGLALPRPASGAARRRRSAGPAAPRASTRSAMGPAVSCRASTRSWPPATMRAASRNPDPFLTAAERLGVPADDCLALEAAPQMACAPPMPPA